MVDYVLVTEISSLGATAALVVGLVYGMIQLKAMKDQIAVSVFPTYTQRYMDLMAKLPTSAYDISTRNEPAQSIGDAELGTLRSFFDLWSEEHYLHTRGLVDRKVWKLWENGIRFHMKAGAFQDGWKRIYDPASERYDAAFARLIIGCMAGSQVQVDRLAS